MKNPSDTLLQAHLGQKKKAILALGGGFLLAQQNSGTVTCINENGVPVAQVYLPGAVSLLLMDP